MTRKPVYDQPDAERFFGRFGGSFIGESLAQPADEEVLAAPVGLERIARFGTQWHKPRGA